MFYLPIIFTEIFTDLPSNTPNVILKCTNNLEAFLTKHTFVMVDMEFVCLSES